MKKLLMLGLSLMLGIGLGLDTKAQSLSAIDSIIQDNGVVYVFWTVWPGKMANLQIGYDVNGATVWQNVSQQINLNLLPEQQYYYFFITPLFPYAFWRIEEF